MNTNFRFNPRQYENHLSVFGNNVLHELINKWNTDSNHSRNPRRPSSAAHHRMDQSTPLPSQKRCVLKSDEPHMLAPYHHIPLTITEPDLDQTRVVNNTFTENNVCTTDQLVNCVERADDFDTDRPVAVTTRDQLLKPVEHCEGPSRLEIEHSGSKPKTSGYDVPVSKEIDWNDMFDTELLEDAITDLDQNYTSCKKQDMNPTTSVTPPELHTETVTKLINETVEQKVDSNENKNLKKTKRKTQRRVTDAIPKKVKKPNNEVSFRKQKYTKTVKNWLNEVDPGDPVEGAAALEDKPQGNNTDCNIEIPKRAKDVKKTVQSRLTNKGGIMKFGKPAADTDTEMTTTDEAAKEPVAPEGSAGKTNKTNGKKAKPKFVAPIKWHTSTEEPTEVNTVSADNATTYTERFTNITDQDIVALLVYRNGHSDMSLPLTEERCDPEGILIHVDDTNYYFKEVQAWAKEILTGVMCHNKIICYEGKNLLMHLKSEVDLDIHDIDAIDVKLGAALLDPEGGAEGAARGTGGADGADDAGGAGGADGADGAGVAGGADGAARAAAGLRARAARLEAELRRDDLGPVFYDIEMKLLPVIAEMEARGVCVDAAELRRMERVLGARLARVERRCHSAAGRRFRVSSGPQVAALLYDTLRLHDKCNLAVKETLRTGAMSTSEAMLRALSAEHELPRLVLEYRRVHKACATFVRGVLQHVRDGELRPRWLQLAAATGRIASCYPNLQAIPKAPFALPDELGDGTGRAEALVFRAVYVARPGRRLLAADFRQAECRVLAHLARDAALSAALAAPDLFTDLAATWLRKAAREVSAEERERTKRVVYAGVYGAGARMLSDVLHVPYERARDVLASFNAAFPSLGAFRERVAAQCERAGAVRSVWGRVRRPPPARRDKAQRQALNFVIQGSAADLCKVSMVGVSRRFRAHSPPVDGHLLLQIHDELVWEVRADQLPLAAGVVRAEMERCGRARGLWRLPVALAAGADWGHMQPYDPPATDAPCF